MKQEIIAALRQHIDAEKAEVLPRFFKTGKGEYGEGDKFMGIAVPHVRQVARQHLSAPLHVVEALLSEEWHECRSCALLILLGQYSRGTREERQRLFDFYLSHTARINNWDLVDISAPGIVGAHLLHSQDRRILYQLARSPLLWERRIAMVSTLAFIREGDLNDAFSLADLLSDSRHDLMQKAVGWMLREAGKRDLSRLRLFLNHHATTMPRTMLRYAIEKLSREERTMWMRQKEER